MNATNHQFPRRPSTQLQTKDPINFENQLFYLRNNIIINKNNETTRNERKERRWLIPESSKNNEATRNERKERRWLIPEGSDGREVTGGGHDAECEECKGELREAEGKATGCAGHARDILHPPPGNRIIGRVRHRWSLYWVHRWVDHVHCSPFLPFFSAE